MRDGIRVNIVFMKRVVSWPEIVSGHEKHINQLGIGTDKNIEQNYIINRYVVPKKTIEFVDLNFTISPTGQAE